MLYDRVRAARMARAPSQRESTAEAIDSCSRCFRVARALWIAEIDRHFGYDRESLVRREFHATIPRQCRRSDAGSFVICLLSAETTLVVSLPGIFTSMTKRERRSTSVAMCELRAPARRSPSQCPGTARSSTSAGRSRIETASMIAPRGCPLLVAKVERRMRDPNEGVRSIRS